MTALGAGLARVLSDVPLREGYLEATAGASTVTGAFARLELGAHPLLPLAVFAFGEWRPAESSAGVGARWRF